MGFYTGYHPAHALAGLGRLTARTGSGPSKDASRVVAAFSKGLPARGACKGKSSERSCDIVSSGAELKVGEFVIAERPVDGETVRVCIPAKGEMTTLKSGKVVEVQKSKDVRAVASALMGRLLTGVGIKTGRDGLRRFVGRNHHAAVAVPGKCVTIRLTGKLAREGNANYEAATAAQRTAMKPFVSNKQVESARRDLVKAKRVASLAKARASKESAKVTALAARVQRAAMQESQAVKLKKSRKIRSTKRK